MVPLGGRAIADVPAYETVNRHGSGLIITVVMRSNGIIDSINSIVRGLLRS